MTRSGGRLRRCRFWLALLLSATFLSPAGATPQDEIRATFERFVAAQNEHDLAKLKPLLLASPDFLWITRGTPIWGSDAALKRFAALYKGTWLLEPDTASLRIVTEHRARYGASFRTDQLHDRCRGGAGADDALSDEPSARQDARRLARVEHFADPGAGTIGSSSQGPERGKGGHLRWRLGRSAKGVGKSRSHLEG